jgi:outer membrane protein
MFPQRARIRPGSGRAVLWAVLLAVAAAPVAAQEAAPVAAQELRIGYIEMARLIDNAPQLIAVRETLQREFAQRDTELKAQEARVAEMEQQYRREADLLPRQTAEGRAFEIETARRNIARLRDRMREDLDARRKELLAMRWPQVEDGIIAFARANDYDLILQSPLPYAAPALDVTDQVLEQLRREQAPSPEPPR